MSLRDITRRLKTSVEELHGERLQDKFAGLGTTPIGELQCRTRAKVGGEISRMRLTPRSGVPALEIVIQDGTGDAVAVFTGRRTVPGIEHGRSLILEGVAHQDERKRKVFMNPAYTLL